MGSAVVQYLRITAAAVLLVYTAVSEMLPEGESGVLLEAALESLSSKDHSSRLEDQLVEKGMMTLDLRSEMTRVYQRIDAQSLDLEGAVPGFFLERLMLERSLQEVQTRWKLLHTETVVATVLIPRWYHQLLVASKLGLERDKVLADVDPTDAGNLWVTPDKELEDNHEG